MTVAAEPATPAGYVSTACGRGKCESCPAHEKGHPEALCQCPRCDHSRMAGAPTRWEHETRFGVGRHGYHVLSGEAAVRAGLAGLGVRLDLVRGALAVAWQPLDDPAARESAALHLAGAYREQGSVVPRPTLKAGGPGDDV